MSTTIKEIRSNYRTALNAVSEIVKNKRREDKTKDTSFVEECKNYAKNLGFKSWNDLALEFKKADIDKDICWNCDHLEDTQIHSCNICGRKGKGYGRKLNTVGA